MKEGWTYKKLGEVFPIIMGKTPPRNIAKYWDVKKETRNLWVSIADLSKNEGGEIHETKEHISDEGKENNKLIPKGSLLVSFKLTLGKMAFAGEDLYTNEAIISLPKRDDVDLMYLYYYFSFLDWNRIASGNEKVKGKTLNKSSLSEIPIAYIPLSEQLAIVARLDSAFAQIDALKANAEKQLSEARQLFQKALEEAMTPKEGWEEKTLKEVSQIAGDYGLNVSSKPFDGIRYLRITDITDWGDLNDDKVSAKVDSDKKQEELEEGDILFARTGATVGKTLVYRKEFGECLYAGYLIRYRLKKDCVLPRYMHYITHSKEYYDWVSTNQEAAAQPNISARKYNLLPIHYPSLETQHSIVAHLDALFSHVRALEEKLKKMKDECDALKQAMLREVFE